ncbi:MAG: lipoprotein [Rhodocyclaceae bacterium]|nr:lipoprotein [Rhodocyclaceae bacterium]
MLARLALICLAALAVSACGIKGPLYLPSPGPGAPASADHSKASGSDHP